MNSTEDMTRFSEAYARSCNFFTPSTVIHSRYCMDHDIGHSIDSDFEPNLVLADANNTSGFCSLP